MAEPGKLGKLAPRQDPRTLQLQNYVETSQLEPIPASTAWDDGIVHWGMMLNDQLGCCTCSAMGHAIQSWTAVNGQEVTVGDGDVLVAYEAVGKYNPDDPSTDQGAVELDVLNYWRKTGIAGHTLGAYAAVDHKNHQLIKAGVYLFDALYIGFQVPQSAMNQFRADQDWDVVARDGGIVGGHAVVVLDYDDRGVRVITWDKVQFMTWAFWDRYVDEAYACFSAEWLKAGAAPNGVLQEKLMADLAELSGQQPQPTPDPTPTPTPPTPDPTPPWQPDQQVLDDIDWIGAMVATARTQYAADEVGVAGGTLAQIGSYPGKLGRYLSRQGAGEALDKPRRPDGWRGR